MFFNEKPLQYENLRTINLCFFSELLLLAPFFQFQTFCQDKNFSNKSNKKK